MQIITRAEWGARYSDGYEQYGFRPVGDLARYFHHTVTRHLSEAATIAYEVSQMRAVEAIGQQRFGAGMSYTALGFPSGRWYQGCTIGRISAHTGKGRNSAGAGLCWVGNYEDNEPTPALVRSTAEMLVHGVQERWWKSPTFTAYHGQLKDTLCPGKHAIKAIPEIHAAAARLIDVGSRSSERTTPAGWRPAVLPELINARLLLAGIKIRGRRSDYDAVAVAEYQGGQVYPRLFPDGLWGPTTEGHYNWTVELQSALIKVGGFLARDGFYGPHTAFTVGRFQSARGLVVDEKAGPVTCAALGIRSHP